MAPDMQSTQLTFGGGPRRLMEMAGSPLDLYRALLAAASGMDVVSLPVEFERSAAAVLRRYLRGARDAWPAELERVLAEAGVSTGYVTRHLLSIGRFAPDVRAALDAGLPLSVARLVNGVDDLEARAVVLAPLAEAGWKSEGGGALLPRGLSRQIERAARRASVRTQRLGEATSGSVHAGWLSAVHTPATPRRPRGNVWLYPNLSRAARRSESLPEMAVEALVASYLPNGGRLVDVTAGNGAIASTARRFGIESWSGDVEPGADFVHRVDARRLLASGWESLVGCADMLVVHPPTYPAWLESQHGDSLATVDGYTDELADMLGGSLGALAIGGVAVMITRPVRSSGRVWLVTSHVSLVMEEFGLTLVGYHLAVSQDGRDEWQVLVGRERTAAAAAPP